MTRSLEITFSSVLFVFFLNQLDNFLKVFKITVLSLKLLFSYTAGFSSKCDETFTEGQVNSLEERKVQKRFASAIMNDTNMSVQQHRGHRSVLCIV